MRAMLCDLKVSRVVQVRLVVLDIPVGKASAVNLEFLVLKVRFSYTCISVVHCVSKKVPTFELSVTLSNLNRF